MSENNAEKDAGTVSPLTGRLRPPFDEDRAAEFIVRKWPDARDLPPASGREATP